MSYGYIKSACYKCGRKILIEANVKDGGVVHGVEFTAVCGPCLEFSADFEAMAAPDAIKDLKEWKAS